VKVGILDHGMGNLRSVAKALEAAGARTVVSSSPTELGRSDALCVPGQGIFGRCVLNMRSGGLTAHVGEWIETGRPYLGICLGMQILFDASEEAGGQAGLGIFGGRCLKLSGDVTIPHIGWNTVGDDYYYFDHSYAIFPEDASIVSGWCDHGQTFAARIERDAVLGVQFHPEKSGTVGISLLRKWVEEQP
jgi:imidazole glycerol-phosphate synthase subunit HisH